MNTQKQIIVNTPITVDVTDNFEVGNIISISGNIYCGRDSVLPKIVNEILELNTKHLPYNLSGSVIFHSAVSPAGIGPTSSNKLEIESSIEPLSRAGVRIHLGKGQISNKTINALSKYNSVYAIVPPVTALLENTIKAKNIVAFPELRMEALYQLQVENFPAIIAVAHGRSIYE